MDYFEDCGSATTDAAMPCDPTDAMIKLAPFLSYANLTLLFAASMTVCAQVLITWLPVFIGRATKELTGGSTGQFADLHALSTHLGLAFLCIFLYVSLRGGTQVLIMLMGLRWRYNLTRTLHSLYFSRKVRLRPIRK